MSYKTQAHYEANKQYYKDRAMAAKRATMEEIRSLKDMKPCIDCGVPYPHYVMQYDHVGDDKVGNVSFLIKHSSRRKVLEEITKCELVCANCHAIRTHIRRCSQTEKAPAS